MSTKQSAALWMALVALAACGDVTAGGDVNEPADGGSEATSNPAPDAGQGTTENPNPNPPDAGTGGTGTGTGNTEGGLPCDVAALMQKRCTSCHGHPLSGSAPMPLVTYAELKAPTPSNHAHTAAEESLARMKNATRPMPPGVSLLPQSEIDVLQRWIDAGEQPATCGGTTDPGTPDAGTTDTGTPDAGTPPPPPPPTDPLPDNGNVCTSKITWLLGDLKSQYMHPGKACINCHASNHGPTFTAAGTVYPSLHEPDDCFGTASPKVEITDAAGHTFSASPNLAGNFTLKDALQFPIRAKVTANGKTREMASAVSSGDCNSCHTQSGDQSAPGRIVSP